MLQLERDLELATLLDGLGYDEFWVGEHHSGGWETIASPEMFLAAAAQRTQRIKLGTGVVSVPYHHPFTVAQRMVMLDMLSRGRAMLGVGPGALPSDAFMLGIDPMTQRDQMDEGLGVIIRLLNEREPITVDGSWYRLRDAALHLRPLQKQMPIAVASMISPAGMKAAGKYGVGVLSVASYMQEGLTALKTQWSFAESSAKEHGKQVDRANWRIVMPFHLADSKEQAYRDVADGLKRWNNEYVVGILGRPDGKDFADGYEAAKFMDEFGGGIFGTPRRRAREARQAAGAVRRLRHDPEFRARLGAARKDVAQLRTDRALRDAAMPGAARFDRRERRPRHREEAHADGGSDRRDHEGNQLRPARGRCDGEHGGGSVHDCARAKCRDRAQRKIDDPR